MVGSSCKANLDQIEGVKIIIIIIIIIKKLKIIIIIYIYIYIYIGMKLPKLLPVPHFKDTHIDELKKPLGLWE
jgi:hypothetical protein